MFESTAWSRIVAAGRGDPGSREGLAERYRPAVVRYLRARGRSEEDAQDLAQEVFLRLFSPDVLARADRARGRFRGWLLGVTLNVMREDQARGAAARRGGKAQVVPLDEGHDVPAATPTDPEFDRAWADQLLRRALDALAAENPRLHATLELRFAQGLAYAAIAERLARNLQQVKNDIHRARQRLIAGIKEELATYCSSEAEYEDELASFLTFLGAPRGARA